MQKYKAKYNCPKLMQLCSIDTSYMLSVIMDEGDSNYNEHILKCNTVYIMAGKMFHIEVFPIVHRCV